jgi:flagellar hook-basal body complex protein FliE
MKAACLDPELSQFIHSIPISIARCATKEAKKTAENVLSTINSQLTQFAEFTTGCDVDSQEENAKQRVGQVSKSQTIVQNTILDQLVAAPVMQEIEIAFTLLHEMRHKLTDGFKELTRLSM